MNQGREAWQVLAGMRYGKRAGGVFYAPGGSYGTTPERPAASLHAENGATCSDARVDYSPSTYANINGATIEASELIMNFGASRSSFHQVIFSLGTAPEYEPNDVVESDI
jgi:hypothetical protein